jgi:hypothetical protein
VVHGINWFAQFMNTKPFVKIIFVTYKIFVFIRIKTIVSLIFIISFILLYHGGITLLFCLFCPFIICGRKIGGHFRHVLRVFGGIHGVSSAVILYVPKLRLVWILWCKISIVLCHKCLRQRTIWRTSKINAFLVQMTLRFL